MCTHQPPCARSQPPHRGAARVVAAHPDQGWSLLCNRVVLFEDGGMLLPDGGRIEPFQPVAVDVAVSSAA